MRCIFCGTETGRPTNHQSNAECVQALESEVQMLKRLLPSRQHRVHLAESGGEAPATPRVAEIDRRSS
jgi:hypothetical protein